MTDADHAYFSVRLLEEQKRAQNARCHEAAAIHRDLANAYRSRLKSLDPSFGHTTGDASTPSGTMARGETLISRLPNTRA
jgi:hypothetical protein